MSKVQFKTLFKKSWLNHEDFKDWLLEDVDKEKFKCKWCGDDTPMALSNMGIRALKSHSMSKKHLKLKASKSKNNAITSYFGWANSSTSITAAISSYFDGTNSSTSISAATSSTAAEIYWALKCTKENWSGNSCDNNNTLFTTMFPDSEIAKKFCMNRTKYSYITNFGIAPFFKDVLKKNSFVLVFLFHFI